MVGGAVSKYLVNKGYKVIVLSRQVGQDNTGRLSFGNSNIAFSKWDVKKHEIDIAALQQADYIIHLAGAGVMDKKWTAAYKKKLSIAGWKVQS